MENRSRVDRKQGDSASEQHGEKSSEIAPKISFLAPDEAQSAKTVLNVIGSPCVAGLVLIRHVEKNAPMAV